MNLLGWFRRPTIDAVVPEAPSSSPAAEPPRAQASSPNSGGYRGARHGERGLTHFEPFASSANASAQPSDRKTAVSRSREAHRNFPIARGAVGKRTDKIISTGLVYHSRIDYESIGMSKDEAQEWQKRAEREFRLFAKTADIRRQMSEAGLQHLALLTTYLSGDALVNFVREPRPGAVYDTRIQIIEGDRVCNPNGKADRVDLVQGCQLNEYGAAIGFHVRNQHPGEYLLGAPALKWQYLDAYGKNTGRTTARLLMFVERPDQYRGMPLLAPLIAPLVKLDKFSDATLMNAIVSSMFTVFLQTPAEGEGMSGLLGDTGAASDDQDAPTSDRRVEMGSGTILELPPGYEPKSFNSTSVSPNFDPFFLAYVRQMAMALNEPYEVMIGHYSSSYTASKAALLDAATTWNRGRQWMRENWCEIVLENFMDEAVDKGRIIAPGYFDDAATRQAYLGAEFIGDVYGSLDPYNEIKAYKIAIDERLMSRARAMAELNGGDWETTIAQIEKEQKDLDAAGILPVAQPGAVSPKDQGKDTKDGKETPPEGEEE